ncbi:AraC family transcriptional regulator [Chitinolyticbacter meiyuanensis]|uniref:AraC family transcriptional regulator n=1 Tax=Chitinolyticbacter meiyuanensis TaxID=682798 RepID=UPI0011E5CDCA|nr:AraC family transcriptional regulator [Chitinolyticbacter meiyuanensis]
MYPDDAWVCVDPLAEALHFLRMNGLIYCRSELTAPWGVALPPLPDCLMFHFVASGSGWLHAQGRTPEPLRAGDFVLLPHGHGHTLTSAPGVATTDLFELDRTLLSPRFEVLRHGAGGEATQVICGAVHFDDPAAHRLVALLPPVLRLDGSTHGQPWLHDLLRFMAVEAQTLQPGGDTVIARLADVLVIQAIRAWMASDPAARQGWLGALQDRQIGRAIALMHRDPGEAWTLATLASQIGMSRSAFAARFTQLVGQPAMQYLADWRMHVALASLKRSAEPLASLALRMGYQSEAAFSRAFKRVIGVSPSAIQPQRQG